MLILKYPENKYKIFPHIHLLRDFDDLDLLGIGSEIEPNTGMYKGKEIEVTIDGNPAIVEIVDYYSEPYSRIDLMNSLFLLTYGLSSLDVKKLLNKKYSAINDKTPVLLVIYKIVEIA